MATPRLFLAGTATAVAPVAALPTTAAQFALWNGEPVDGKTYTITSVGFTSIASCAAAQILQLLGLVSAARQPIISGTAATGPKSTDGIVGGTSALAASAVTLTAGMLAGGMWHPIGGSVNTAALTATISTGTWTNVRGLYLLPPGGLFALAVLCNAAGSATCDCFVTWEEA